MRRLFGRGIIRCSGSCASQLPTVKSADDELHAVDIADGRRSSLRGQRIAPYFFVIMSGGKISAEQISESFGTYPRMLVTADASSAPTAVDKVSVAVLQLEFSPAVGRLVMFTLVLERVDCGRSGAPPSQDIAILECGDSSKASLHSRLRSLKPSNLRFCMVSHRCLRSSVDHHRGICTTSPTLLTLLVVLVNVSLMIRSSTKSGDGSLAR
jgi:hypothetical protein